MNGRVGELPGRLQQRRTAVHLGCRFYEQIAQRGVQVGMRHQLHCWSEQADIDRRQILAEIEGAGRHGELAQV